MTTTLTTNFKLPKPPLGSVGTADGYGTLLDTADAMVQARSPWYTIDANKTGYEHFYNAVTTLNALGTPCTLIVPSGTHYTTTNGLVGGTQTDITVNATVHVVFLKGAILSIGTKALTSLITSTFVAGGTNDLTTISGSALITSAGGLLTPSGLTAGAYIATPGGGTPNYYRIADNWSGSATVLCELVSSAEAGVTWTRSPITLTGNANFTTELLGGDFIYVSGVTGMTGPVIVESVVDATNLNTADFVPRPCSGASATRSCRAIFLGGITAGPYQIFAGDGVARLNVNVNSECLVEWWGASAQWGGTNGTANVGAFRKAATSFYDPTTTPYSIAGNGFVAGRICLMSGFYNINDEIVVSKNEIVGNKSGSIIIPQLTSMPNPWLIRSLRNTYQTGPPTNFIWRDFYCSNNYAHGDNLQQLAGIVYYGGGDGAIFDELRFSGGGRAMRVMAGTDVFIHKPEIFDTTDGFYVSMEGVITGAYGTFGIQSLTDQKDFSATGSWAMTGGSGWTIAGGHATHSKGNTNSLYQDIITNNLLYGAVPYPNTFFLLKLTVDGGGFDRGNTSKSIWY